MRTYLRSLGSRLARGPLRARKLLDFGELKRLTWVFAQSVLVNSELIAKVLVVVAVPLASALLGNVLLTVDQGQDLLRDFSVAYHSNWTWKSNAPSVLSLLVSSYIWALTNYYCAARLIASVPAGVPGGRQPLGWNVEAALRVHVPLVLALASLLPLATGVSTAMDTFQPGILPHERPYWALVLASLGLVEAVLWRCRSKALRMVVILALASVASWALFHILQAAGQTHRLEELTPAFHIRIPVAFALGLISIAAIVSVLDSADLLPADVFKARIVAAVAIALTCFLCFSLTYTDSLAISPEKASREVLTFTPFVGSYPEEAGLVLTLAALAMYFGIRCGRSLLTRWPSLNPLLWMSHAVRAEDGEVWFGVIAFAFGAALAVAFVVSPVYFGDKISTIPLVFLWLAIATAVLSIWLTTLPRRLGLPSLIGIPVLLFWLGSHALDSHEMHGVVPHIVANDNVAKRMELKDHFVRWQQVRNLSANDPVFVVAAAGGGARAAAWTGLALGYLDDMTCGEFSRHLYAISGVSGGTLGAAAFAATKTSANLDVSSRSSDCSSSPDLQTVDNSEQLNSLVEFLGSDMLSPVAGSLLFPDMLQRFSGLRWLTHDRGWAIEHTWEERWGVAASQTDFSTNWFSEPFLKMYAGDSLFKVPLLFINSVSVEDGRRVIAAPVRASIDAYDLFDPRLVTGNLKLSSAVHNSARFTYLSPAGLVYQEVRAGVEPWGRLVDGGYFENSGSVTAEEIVEQIALAQSGRRDNIFIVVLSNEPRAKGRRLCRTRGGVQSLSPIQSAERRTVDPRVALSDISSPVEALLATREARGDYAVRDLAKRNGCANVYEVFLARSIDIVKARSGAVTKTYIEGTTTDAPLGWYLSTDAYDTLTHALYSDDSGDVQVAPLELERIAARTLGLSDKSNNAAWLKTRRVNYLCENVNSDSCNQLVDQEAAERPRR